MSLTPWPTCVAADRTVAAHSHSHMSHFSTTRSALIPHCITMAVSALPTYCTLLSPDSATPAPAVRSGSGDRILLVHCPS